MAEGTYSSGNPSKNCYYTGMQSCTVNNQCFVMSVICIMSAWYQEYGANGL
jgi:hypothetical protein